MRGAVSKDSLMRCEQPSMLYDAIRKPTASPPKSRVEANDPSRDTLESTQQRLNREMLEKFQNTSSRLSHHSYIAVSQTGKYLFLAIMLPPYLCCYGIPKWLFSTLVPQTFTMVKTQVMRVGQFFYELSARVTDLMKGAIEQMLGDALRASYRQAKAFKDFFKNSIKARIAFLKKIKEKAQKFHADIHQGIYSFFIRKRDALRKWLENRALHVIEKIILRLKKILAVILYPVDLLDRFLVNPICRWLKDKIELSLLWLKWVYGKMAAEAAKVRQWVFLKLQPLVNGIQWCVAKGTALVNRWWVALSNPCIRLAKQIYAKASLAATVVKNKMSVFWKKVSDPIKALTQRVYHSGKVLIGRLITPLKRFAIPFWQPIFKKISEKKAKRRAMRAEHPRYLGQVFKKAGQHVGMFFKTLFQQGLRLWKALWEMGVWWLKLVIAFPVKSLGAVFNLFKVCVTAMQKGVYKARITLAWFVACYQLGMIQVRELTAFLK